MTTESETEEREFQRLRGPWDDLTPALATQLLEVLPTWWISGSWAIEAFARVARPHKDADVTVFRRDAQELRRHFHGRYDPWSAGSATLRPLDDAPSSSSRTRSAESGSSTTPISTRRSRSSTRTRSRSSSTS